MVPSLTPYVPITFPPSQLGSAGSPGIKLATTKGFWTIRFHLGNVNIFPSKINSLSWSKTTLGAEGSGTELMALLLSRSPGGLLGIHGGQGMWGMQQQWLKGED